jgi:4-hydroxy-tetrahydrodipicolinate reductase
MSYRVVQWTTGNVGQRAVRAIAEHPDLELVGLFAHAPDKQGRDAGELAGIAPLGVRATDDVEALLALEADCVSYMPLLPDYDLLGRFLRAGTNVVSTASFMLGNHLPDGVQAGLIEAAREGGASIFGSGINPGFMNLISALLTGVCDRVHSVRMTEIVDCRDYASPETWTGMGWGLPVGRQSAEPGSNPMTVVFYDAIDVMADILGVEIEEHRFDAEFSVTTRELDVGLMRFPQGTVAGQRSTFSGMAHGRPVIELKIVWTMGPDTQPDWSGPEGYRIEIEGEPSLRTFIEIEAPSVPGLSDEKERMGQVMVATAMPAINAIPFVCRAVPGIVTYAELPPIGARGLVTR